MIGKTSALNLTSSFQELINNPSNSSNVVEIVTLIVANTSANDATIDIIVTRNSTNFSILKSATLPANKSLSVFLSKDFGIYLEPGDVLKAKANDSFVADAVCSYYLLSQDVVSNSSSSS